MKRHQLEHLIRAAGSITGCREIHVVGSQAVLATLDTGPAELFLSREADVFIDERPDLSDLIDGTIGELSPFDQTFGYYAHGVGAETATLPDGWKERLVRLENANTGGAAGLCLEIHDLTASKLHAGREKDRTFVTALLKEHLLSIETLRQRLDSMPTTQEEQKIAQSTLDRLIQAS